MADTILDQYHALMMLVETLRQWQEAFKLPNLSFFGMSEGDIPRVVVNSRGNSMKTNPVWLSDEVLAAILQRCL
jgi:alcohol dehydrogenase